MTEARPQIDSPDVPEQAVLAIQRELDVHPVVARILVGRGIDTPAQAKKFLRPRLGDLRPPKGLSGFEKAMERLCQAVETKERIGVFGDYDADGATAAAILTLFLREIGQTCDTQVAHREGGYGVTKDVVDSFAASGCSVIVTVDCGTKDIAAITHASNQAMDVIVVDHHTVPEDVANHPAFALVNPMLPCSTFPFAAMASAGLAFYMVAGLRSALVKKDHHLTGDWPDVRQYLDLAAIGTVADQVPLTEENRILVSAGLARLNQTHRPGIDALLKMARPAKRKGGGNGNGATDTIDARTIGFTIAPRLNAPGRLGDATPALEVLLAKDDTAEQAATAVETANKLRRKEHTRVLKQAREQLVGTTPEDHVFVYGEDWPVGVLGIVAARLREEYQKPAFVISWDAAVGETRGSARCGPECHLVKLLDQCSEALLRYGGHPGAAGFTVKPDSIEAFSLLLTKHLANLKSSSSQTDSLMVDAELSVDEIDMALVSSMSLLEPFGQANEMPKVVLRKIHIVSFRAVGDGSHAKLVVAGEGGNTISAIAFGLASKVEQCGSYVDLLCYPVVNTWMGNKSVELSIQDIWPADGGSIAKHPATA